VACPRAGRGTTRRRASRMSTPVREPAVDDDWKGDFVYIGIGTLVFILVVLLIIYFVRRV